MGAKKKPKKGGAGGGFKINPKVDKEADIVQELQIKKKYLEEKYSKI
jgi:hypothetical protein